VNGQHLDIWEFGKGALSGKSPSAAVLQLKNKVQAKVEAEAKDKDRG